MTDLFDPHHLPTHLRIRVTPRAKSARIKKEITSDGEVYYKIYVTAVAEDGKANQAVIELLADFLGVPKSALTIIRGITSRDKVIEIKKLS